MNISSFLNAPFPRLPRNKQHLLGIVLIGISCSFFIILFKPFGIQNSNNQWYFNLAIISMGIVFIASYLFIEWIVPSVIPNPFKTWTLSRAIAWYTLVILFIGAAMFLYKSFLAGFTDFTLKEYFFVIGRTFLIALTVSFFSLGLYQYFSRKPISFFANSTTYDIKTSAGKNLSINPQQILYISSDDNYVDVHYEVNGHRTKAILRSSLKHIEAQLVNQISPIHRCHRRFLINVNRFESRKITSRNMIIVLKDHPDELPVSRQYIERIKQLMPTRP